MRKVATTLITAAILATSSAFYLPAAVAQDSQTGAGRNRLSPEKAKAVIEGRAREVMLALKNRDMRHLSTLVHPAKGVRFSQYGYVYPKNRVFSRSQVSNLFKSNRRYVWGEYDGSGDPIRLTAREYFKKFVYRQDMIRAKEVSYNRDMKFGNSIPNFLEAYPRAITVAYFHPGSDPRFDGMDWQVLWLAFEKQGQTWYLVGIASDEWTI